MAELKPDILAGALLASPATAAYIANLMFEHPVVEVTLRSYSGAQSWVIRFTLSSHAWEIKVVGDKIREGSLGRLGGSYFEYGIVNISRWKRHSTGSYAIELGEKDGLSVVGEDRKQMSKFLNQLSQALAERTKEGPPSGGFGATSTTIATTTPGRVKLKLRATADDDF